ncbi:MAG: NAD-dependent epimerase/dehydratase family protein [Deltaproteobacteria bacterium]|nr:MAG: NAD-dependent epimerase/dehydratase family protein [Deltaproteobacteria bacterium]
MRVAVTGGAGQLGTLVLRRLCADRTIADVRSLDLRPPLAVSPKLNAIQADVRDPGFARHLEGCDVLVHLAFLVAKRGKREMQVEVNVEGSKNVFRAALQAGVRRIVYASSVAAYGVVAGHPEPLMVRFRPVILLGRRMEHVLGSALRRGVLPDSGATPLPVVWDEDVADAFVLAVKSETARGAFNLAADEPLPSRQLARAAGLRTVTVPKFFRKTLAGVDALAARLGLVPPMDPGWLGGGEARMIVSGEKARRELGWKPRCAKAVEVVKRQVETVPRKLDRRLSLLFRAVDRASRREPPRPDLAGYETTIHLELSGPDGGDVTLRANGGRLSVRKGAPRPADGAVFLPARLLLDLLTRKADFASAQLTGRIRTEGQGLASMVVGGMIGGFLAATKTPGFAGRAARALQRWMAKA